MTILLVENKLTLTDLFCVYKSCATYCNSLVKKIHWKHRACGLRSDWYSIKEVATNIKRHANTDITAFKWKKVEKDATRATSFPLYNSMQFGYFCVLNSFAWLWLAERAACNSCKLILNASTFMKHDVSQDHYKWQAHSLSLVRSALCRL